MNNPLATRPPASPHMRTRPAAEKFADWHEINGWLRCLDESTRDTQVGPADAIVDRPKARSQQPPGSRNRARTHVTTTTYHTPNDKPIRRPTRVRPHGTVTHKTWVAVTISSNTANTSKVASLEANPTERHHQKLMPRHSCSKHKPTEQHRHATSEMKFPKGFCRQGKMASDCFSSKRPTKPGGNSPVNSGKIPS